jgi:hypothetical protein
MDKAVGGAAPLLRVAVSRPLNWRMKKIGLSIEGAG